MYCKATPTEADKVCLLLKTFEDASGQQVNRQKSDIFFSRNVSEVSRRDVCRRMQMNEAAENAMYLGLPNTMGRNKNAILGFLKERIRKRVMNWDGQMFSKPGKEILLKTVVQALPTFAMSVFLLPSEMCKEIEQMMCKFWWRKDKNAEKGIHWASWDKLCRPKGNGGMGFRKLHDFNLALLGKQVWRLLNKEDSLVYKVFKARYFPRCNVLEAGIGNSPSFIWRSLWAAQELVRTGTRWRIGSGDSVKVLEEAWLQDRVHPFVVSRHPALENQTVASLMKTGERVWDTEVIQDLFVARDQMLILGIPLSHSHEEDSRYWSGEDNGFYTVKSAYNLIQTLNGRWDPNANSGFWRKLWNLKIPPKVKDFLWRACSGYLPTRMALQQKHVPILTHCPMCNNNEETTMHCLARCNFAQACICEAGFGNTLDSSEDFEGWLNVTLSSYSRLEAAELVMSLWSIWKARNMVVWHGTYLHIDEVVRTATITLDQWRDAQAKNFVPSSVIMQSLDGKEHWMKPERNTIKVNVDAAIFKEENSYGFGYVARDHTGRVLGARAASYPGVISAELAEAIGCKEALSWIKSKQWGKTYLETDCSKVVQAIHSSVNIASPLGLIVSDCKQLMLQIADAEICFVKRSANKVAHCLARQSYFHSDRTFTESNIPIAVLDLCMNDLNE